MCYSSIARKSLIARLRGARRREMGVRLNLMGLLRTRGLTRYGLAKASGISLSAVYRLAGRSGRFTRLEAETIDRLCAALRCTPGELIRRD